VLGVDDGDDRVKPQLGVQRVHEERLGDRGGVGEASGLDEDRVESGPCGEAANRGCG
jgi:hypothetical protein